MPAGAFYSSTMTPSYFRIYTKAKSPPSCPQGLLGSSKFEFLNFCKPFSSPKSQCYCSWVEEKSPRSQKTLSSGEGCSGYPCVKKSIPDTSPNQHSTMVLSANVRFFGCGEPYHRLRLPIEERKVVLTCPAGFMRSQLR